MATNRLVPGATEHGVRFLSTEATLIPPTGAPPQPTLAHGVQAWT